MTIFVISHVLRQTVNEFCDEGEDCDDIDVAYGDGLVAATSRGELSVPTKYVDKDLCESLYTTWTVSEYNTSTACTECGAQLVPVYQLHNQNVFQTRGLKWCNSSECKGCPLKHRENIGAINISTMFLFEVYGVPLPVLLDRYHPVQALKLNTKRLANQYHLRAPHSSIGKNAKKRAYHLG